MLISALRREHPSPPEPKCSTWVPVPAYWLGPVLRERADWLQVQGLIEHGQEKEELVVIRAGRP
ncbi:hypothetical protein ACWCP8_20265 [Streptomyces sp. NPDC002206]